MKILLVNTRHYYGGGDSTYTFNLASLLRLHGHQISFFAMKGDNNVPDPNEDLFVPYIDFRELNKNKSIVNGVKVVGRAIYSKQARTRFSELLDRVHPDIVHLQNIHAHITPSIIFEAKIRKLPVVWTLHDYKLVCPNSHLLIDTTGQICEACIKGGFLYPFIKRCKKGSILASGMASVEAICHQLMGVSKVIDGYLSPSAFLAHKLREGGVPGNIYHIPLFIDKLQKVGKKDEGYFLFLGRLDRIKGIHSLLDASQKNSALQVVCAGLINETEEATIRAAFVPNTNYVGFKIGSELRELIQNCRAVVVPSISYENQPFSVLEAFAAGKPVIASNLGGMSELVTHMDRGLLVRPNDPDDLSSAMTWLSENPKDALRMGRSAFEYVKQAHSADSHYQSLMNIYSKLVKF